MESYKGKVVPEEAELIVKGSGEGTADIYAWDVWRFLVLHSDENKIVFLQYIFEKEE